MISILVSILVGFETELKSVCVYIWISTVEKTHVFSTSYFGQ
jgi:hypothetical protein